MSWSAETARERAVRFASLLKESILILTALLRALANKQIPGVPLNLRILLLGQTRDVSAEEALSGLKIEQETVLGHVIRSNVAREENLAEEKRTAPSCRLLFFLIWCRTFRSHGHARQRSNAAGQSL